LDLQRVLLGDRAYQDGTKFPITSALKNLLFALQRQFVAGLTLGASKG
jgi:hypothetical protein